MLRLTRDVRFAVNLEVGAEGAPGAGKGPNAYAGNPGVRGAAVYYRAEVTVQGELEPRSQYLLNIKDIDDAVRGGMVPVVSAAVRGGTFAGGEGVLRSAVSAIRAGLENRRVKLVTLRLWASPFVSLTLENDDVVKLSVKFEFAAAHRLHNRDLSDAENLATFGKCNNPLGHGHNYEVQVTVRGDLARAGELERLVDEHVIKAFDHKHLNAEVPDFAETIPSVENIARAAYVRLKGNLPGLESVTVWETPKTWAEYSE